MHVLSAAEMQACDRATTERFGVPSIDLMRAASSAVAALARRQFPSARRVTVLCGRGNNGGDGMMAARLLAQDGLDGDDAADRFRGDFERRRRRGLERAHQPHAWPRLRSDHGAGTGTAQRRARCRFDDRRARRHRIQAAAQRAGAGGARVDAAERRAGSRRGPAFRLARRRNRGNRRRPGLSRRRGRHLHRAQAGARLRIS